MAPDAQVWVSSSRKSGHEAVIDITRQETPKERLLECGEAGAGEGGGAHSIPCTVPRTFFSQDCELYPCFVFACFVLLGSGHRQFRHREKRETRANQNAKKKEKGKRPLKKNHDTGDG